VRHTAGIGGKRHINDTIGPCNYRIHILDQQEHWLGGVGSFQVSTLGASNLCDPLWACAQTAENPEDIELHGLSRRNVITIVDVTINVKKNPNKNEALYHFRHNGNPCVDRLHGDRRQVVKLE